MLSRATNAVTGEEIKSIIAAKCSEGGLDLPEDWRKDFDENVPLKKAVKSFEGLQSKICERINRLLDEKSELGEKYGEIYSKASLDVRLAIALALGLEEFIQESHELLNGLSPREAIHLFLSELPEGKTWERKELMAWKKDEVTIGKKSYKLSYAKDWSFNCSRFKNLIWSGL